MPTEWTKGPVFAEVAETLGVPTKQILAMMPEVLGSTTVLFTPNGEDQEEVWFAVLRPDADRILREQHRSLAPNFVADLLEKLERGQP